VKPVDLAIDVMTGSDWEPVRRIYREGIATGDATFETEPPDRDGWSRDHLDDCRLVARAGDDVVGWAALSPVTERCVHRGVAEVSVYVATAVQGKGVGTALLRALVDFSERAGIWTLQAGVFPENRASIALHETCGFRRVGVRERLGSVHGRWRDVVLLERRSATVGTEDSRGQV
jgi:phosphinothricin acetyltransferase